MLALVPVDSGGRAVRSGGPDSWACWWCYYGTQAAAYAVVAAAGIAITAATGGTAPAIIGALATALSVEVTTVVALAATVGGVTISSFISLLAQKVCEAILNTCSEKKVSISGPWKSSQIHSWGAQAPGQPALVNFRGQPVILHRAGSGDNFYYAAYDLGSGDWPGSDTKVTGSSLVAGGGLGAVVLNGTLYAIYRRSSSSTLGLRSTTDLTTWAPEVALSITASADAALAEFGTQIVGVAPSQNSILQSFVLQSSGSLAGDPSPLSGVFCNTQPALEWFNGLLLCAYVDRPTGALRFLAMDADGSSTSWTPTTSPQTSGTLKGGPALYALNATTLYCLYTLSDGSIHYSFTGPDLNWATETAISGQAASTGPALVGQGSTLFAIHLGKGGENIWFDVAQVD